MTSKRQIAANRKNASLGGVKTMVGKGLSRLNSARHGILKESMTEYEGSIHERIINELIDTFQPHGEAERMLVERIALLQVKLTRVQIAETEYLRSVLDPHITHIDGLEMSFGETIVDRQGYIPRIDDNTFERIDKTFTRYETNYERRLLRLMHELERIQRARRGEMVVAPLSVDINEMGSFGKKE